MISIHFQGKPFNITVIQAYARQVTLNKLKLNSSMKTYRPFRTNTKKKKKKKKKGVFFITGDRNAKVGSQGTPGVTGKFGLGVWNEGGQRLIEFSKRTHWS